MTAVPAPGVHGGDGARVAAALGLDPALIVDLSQSLNPFAPDVTEIVAKHLDSLRRYPIAADAEAALAAAINVDPDRLVLTNGGAEAIALVARVVGGSVVSEPEFALHPRHGVGAARWRSDPHNPTGRLAAPGDQADVWDEAFYPLATGEWTAGRPGWVVGSLTKVFACPGLRLGYAIAPDADGADALRADQPTWSVSGPACEALPDLLALADLVGWAAALATARAVLIDALAAHGFSAEPTDAPWVLVHAPGLRDRLAPHGVIVRDCESFGMQGWARIAVPDHAGRLRLEEALCAAG